MHRLQSNRVFLFLPLAHLNDLLYFESRTSWWLLVVIFHQKLLRNIASSICVGYLRDRTYLILFFLFICRQVIEFPIFMMLRCGIKSVHIILAIGLFIHSHPKRHFSIHLSALSLFFLSWCCVFIRLNQLLLHFRIHKCRWLPVKIPLPL